MRPDKADIGHRLKIDLAEQPLTIASPPVAPHRPPSLGAMSQQGSNAYGHQCYPQQLLHLVGYRDLKASPGAWDRRREDVVDVD